MKHIKCAIYTRKSSEEGLEQNFNSLHAQREACEAFIQSQKHEGWTLHPNHYDDGGFSGGNMERPAIKALLADIAAHKINVVVVYKVDRLTRSLADFAKMVELFDSHNISFVSVTQQFNTTSSMGRLTLNVLLSFAQFEREVTGERIRDKFAASKKKGMWMGGQLPLGYDVLERKLLVNHKEAEVVREIFTRYVELGTVTLLQKDLKKCGIHTKTRNYGRGGNRVLSRGNLYKMLSNPIYIGQIRHKELCYPGLHEAIIDQALWDQVQQCMFNNTRGNKTHSGPISPSPLKQKIFDVSGERLVTVQAKKRGRRYRYYISQSLILRPKEESAQSWRLSAREIEKTAAHVVLQMLQDQSAITSVLHNAEVPARYISVVLDAAKKIIENRDIEPDSIDIFKCVERIELRQDGFNIKLSLVTLIPDVITELESIPTISRDVPMTMKRRGVEMQLVLGGGGPAKPDHKLIKTIVMGRKWFHELVSGRVKTSTEIAVREGLDNSYVTRYMNLAFLAPEIIESIVAGYQPVEVNIEMLTKQIDLPLDWEEQKHVLGFA